jgi:hypothetical protein
LQLIVVIIIIIIIINLHTHSFPYIWALSINNVLISVGQCAPSLRLGAHWQLNICGDKPVAVTVRARKLKGCLYW